MKIQNKNTHSNNTKQQKEKKTQQNTDRQNKNQSIYARTLVKVSVGLDCVHAMHTLSLMKIMRQSTRQKENWLNRSSYTPIYKLKNIRWDEFGACRDIRQNKMKILFMSARSLKSTKKKKNEMWNDESITSRCKTYTKQKSVVI